MKSLYFKKNNCVYLFIGCAQSWLLRRLFSGCGDLGSSLAWCTGFSFWQHLLVWSTRSGCLPPGISAPGLQSTGSEGVERGLSCSETRGISLDQGLNPCFWHWQADSLPWTTREALRSLS